MSNIKITFNENNVIQFLNRCKKETFEEFGKKMVEEIKPITPVDKRNRIGKGELRDSVDYVIEDNKLYLVASSEHMSKYGKKYGYYGDKKSYDYAYEQHETEAYSHTGNGTHHFITSPLYKNEKLLLEIFENKLKE